MAFKFDDDEHEITLSGSKEPVKKGKEIPLPEAGKLPKAPKTEPIPEKPKLPLPPKEEIKTTPQIITPQPIIAPQPIEVNQIIEEQPYVQEQYEYDAPEPDDYNPFERKPTSSYNKKRIPESEISLTRKREAEVFNEDFGVQERNPSEIKTNMFFTAVEPSPLKFIRPEEAKRRKEFLRQITIVRAGLIAILTVTIAAGVYSFIPKPSFSERPQDVNYALTETGKFRAAATAAENYALEFVNDFMNRTEETEPNRQKIMLRYLAPEAYSAINSDLPIMRNNSNREVTVYQKITSGPYVYRIENLDAAQLIAQSNREGGYVATFVIRAEIQKYVTNGDFTVVRPILSADGIETGQFESVTEAPTFDKEWVYISVPVLYNRNNNEITLYGFPTFVTESKNENLKQYIKPFEAADWTRADQALASSNVLKAQIESFMVAWSKQNPNVAPTGELASLISQDATNRAKEGLNGKYVASPERGQIVTGISVEALNTDEPPTGNETRRALINVIWATSLDVEQKTIVEYSQQYIITFRGSDTNSYKIIDIKPRYAE
jgi:hypothetical protein